MTTLSWYNSGTCSVTNASTIVTGVSTVWLTNVDAREAFRGPDGLLYEIQSIDSDTQITLATTYKGSTLVSQPYSICPLTGYERSIAADAASLLTKAGALLNQAPTTLDILQYRGATWVTRNPSQYTLDLFTGPSEQTIASALGGTTDISVSTSHRVAISGTNTISGLGTTTVNCLRWVRFTASLTLTHNATSLILPSAANVKTNAGDTALFASDGAGNWRCLQYNFGTALYVNATGSVTLATVVNQPVLIVVNNATVATFNAAAMSIIPTTLTVGANTGFIKCANVAGIANGGFYDFAINPGGGGWPGLLVVSNSNSVNAGAHTTRLYSVIGRINAASFVQLDSQPGAGGGFTFSISCPSDGVIRITNTGGSNSDMQMALFGCLAS